MQLTQMNLNLKNQQYHSDKIQSWLVRRFFTFTRFKVNEMVQFLNYHQLQDKLQYFVCGFDIRGTVTEINKETGEQTQRPIKPQETVWVRYEEIFTNNYKIISPEYKTYLDKFEEGDYPAIEKENYVRVWTRPVDSYARTMQNLIFLWLRLKITCSIE
jgi:hypothetical protein